VFKTSEYRENAKHCIKIANDPVNDRHRETLLFMAREWISLAAELEGRALQKDEFCAVFVSVGSESSQACAAVEVAATS